MDIQKRMEGDIAVLSIEGRLDLTSASVLKDMSKQVIESESKKMILNLDKVDFINSSGLGALVSILKDVRSSQGSMKLTNLAPYVKEIFDITQLANIFDIFPDEKQAISSY